MSSGRRSIIGSGFLQRGRRGVAGPGGDVNAEMTLVAENVIFKVGPDRTIPLDFQATPVLGVGSDFTGPLTFQASFTLVVV